MANDISYFKVEGDQTQYSFNDADLEARIGATALPTTAQTVTGAIAEHEADIGTLSGLTTSAKSNLVAAINEVDAHADANAAAISQLNSKFAFVSGVSTHTLTTSGLYYCSADCTDLPSPSPVTKWVIAVIANTAGTTVKQIARAAAGEGYEYEQHLLGGTWSGWIDVGRMVPFSGSFTSATYFHKPGNANYGSFLIMGTLGGVGGVVIACTVANGSLGTVINLLTGAAWSNSALTITYGVTDGIGYVGLKTTSSNNSSGVIIGG